MNDSPRSQDADNDNIVTTTQRPWTEQFRKSEDWWAIYLGVIILGAAWLITQSGLGLVSGEEGLVSPLKGWFSKPGSWTSNPLDAISLTPGKSSVQGIITIFLLSLGLFGLGAQVMGRSFIRFAGGYWFVFLLALIAYVATGQVVVKQYNLEYALWALGIGLLISNTVGTPGFVKPALMTEFFIKTGLVLLGAEVLISKLIALGVPGICIAWVVTPIVLISTYIFGQKVLKLESKSLNMVISADMSVCGVSAAIATAAACRAKKEELSFAIGLSLSFTVIMMIVLPALIKAIGLSPIVGGAWIGGTIDSTGAVAVAGTMLGDAARDVAVTIKMIQNILIGVTAFGVAVYWVSCVEKDSTSARPQVSEIWHRFPKFVLGFMAASLIFSWIYGMGESQQAVVDAMKGDCTKVLRGWFFCLAFVSIGLESNFRDLAKFLVGSKPLVLYVCGQSLNLILTLFMSWLMFEVVFSDAAQQLLN